MYSTYPNLMQLLFHQTSSDSWKKFFPWLGASATCIVFSFVVLRIFGEDWFGLSWLLSSWANDVLERTYIRYLFKNIALTNHECPSYILWLNKELSCEPVPSWRHHRGGQMINTWQKFKECLDPWGGFRRYGRRWNRHWLKNAGDPSVNNQRGRWM